MANVRTIHVDWYSQRPPRFDGGPQLAYQGDHLSNMVVFDNAPELPNYYLLVEMKTDDEGTVIALPGIMLEGPYWVIPNYYTQICQQITYQVCCKTESGDYEHHSAKFKGTILPVLKHNGEPIDQSPMFDPYIDILDKRVNELIVTAGDIQIDSELKSDSANPVQNKVVKAAFDEIGENVDEINGRLDNFHGVSIPASVRQAIYNRLNHALYSDADAPADMSIIEAWASTNCTAITLSASTLTFTGEGSQTLTATLSPADCEDVPAWSSSNTAVATVSSNGVVTAVGNGTCTIYATVGSIVAACDVSVSGVIVRYTVSTNLTNCTTSNPATVVVGGEAYTATLTADTASTLTSVTVTMGGTDITSSVYSNGNISIDSVTGPIVVTAEAESALLYTLPSPTTFDGTASVVTGVNLFKGLGDVDWSITGTFTDSWTDDVNVGKTLFGYSNGNNLVCSNNTGNTLNFLAGSQVHACQGTVAKGATGIVRKVVLRRAQGELSITFDSKVNDTVDKKVASPASTKTLSDYLNTPLPIYIGGLSASATINNYIGTCNEFSIYKTYLSDSDVAAYME